MVRGMALYDLFMANRWDRAAADEAGVMSLLSRLAAQFRLQDERERGGRRSWDPIEEATARHAHLLATVLNNNAAGIRREKPEPQR
jgi:hypothetical protein